MIPVLRAGTKRKQNKKMRRFKMEITLVFYRKRKRRRKEIRVQKKFEGSIFLIASVMLKYIFLAYHKKAKIEHCSIHFVHDKKKETALVLRWKMLKNIWRKKMWQNDPARMTILVMLNVIMVFWLIDQKVLTVSLSYSYANGETVAEDNIVTNDKEDAKSTEEIKGLIEKIRKIIPSEEEKCQKDKEKGECTDPCLKNEKEIIDQMNREQRQGWLKYIASRPRIAGNLATGSRKVSCKEPDDGHPSYSQKNSVFHQDEDCCPDPDEWPKPGCIYDARGLALMLKGPPAHLKKPKNLR